MPWGLAAASAAATVVGGVISSSANKDAASTAAAGQAEAARITADANAAALDKQLAFNKQAQDEVRAASGRGLTDIDKGVSDYSGTVAPLLTPAPITLPSYRGLTTQQQTAEGDMLRGANATMAASGLRGAGRAGVGAVLDQDRRFHEDAAAANDAAELTARQGAQGVANQARSGLAGIQAAAGGSKANTELLTGNALGSSLTGSGQASANLTQASGKAAANAAANSAGYNAEADIANGKLASNTFGSLAGTFASPYLSGNPNTTASQSYVDNGPWDTGA